MNNENNNVEQNTEVVTTPVVSTEAPTTPAISSEVVINKEEPEKKEGSGGTVLAIVFGVMIIVGFLFMTFFNDWAVEHLPSNITRLFGLQSYDDGRGYTPSKNTTPVEENKTESNETKQKDITINSKSSGIYKSPKTVNGEEDSGFLVLRKDGSFVYDSSTKECLNPYVGTFLIENNVIKFKVKFGYNCEGCSTGRTMNDFEATVLDDNTISMEEMLSGNTVSNVYRRDDSDTTDISNYLLEPNDAEACHPLVYETNETN